MQSNWALLHWLLRVRVYPNWQEVQLEADPAHVIQLTEQKTQVELLRNEPGKQLMQVDPLQYWQLFGQGKQ